MAHRRVYGPGPNPSGLCMCGCGQPAPIAKRTSSDKGWVKGEPIQFIEYHRVKKPRPPRPQRPDYLVEDRGYKTPCHIWQRNLKDGYGRASVGNKERKAHVVAWEKVHGPVPDGLMLDHLCRVRACINVDHLEPVTNAVNIQRGDKAKLTPDDVRSIRLLKGQSSGSVLAAQFGVSKRTVNDILDGKSWKNVA